MKNQLGVIGLAVMGKNLALNIVDHGFSVSVFNRSSGKTNELLKDTDGKDIHGYYTLEEFVESLEQPRKIILMVKAGEAVDETIRLLLPLIAPGDIIMDGGNSYYEDTLRRSKELKACGILYLGTGISGGEEGARKGPAIMPGGDMEAYRNMEPILTAISAKVDNDPCSKYIGPDGAGHFVKMVHNGIEYADMQLICEVYDILKKLLRLTPPELSDVFGEWNKGELNSYLIDITSKIFLKKDEDTEHYLVDMILDSARQKGTGIWTGQVSLALGVPTPTIMAAVYERNISAMKQERLLAGAALRGPKTLDTKTLDTKTLDSKSKDLVEAIRKALYAGKICAYAQGFGLLREASLKYDWKLNYGEIASIFRGGCIIRAQFLNLISSAYERNPDLTNLLLGDYFRDIISNYQEELREVIKTAITAGISVPALSSALSYYDSYRSSELPMNLLQAQRDYFGAHTYQRRDKTGDYHTSW